MGDEEQEDRLISSLINGTLKAWHLDHADLYDAVVVEHVDLPPSLHGIRGLGTKALRVRLKSAGKMFLAGISNLTEAVTVTKEWEKEHEKDKLADGMLNRMINVPPLE